MVESNGFDRDADTAGDANRSGPNSERRMWLLLADILPTATNRSLASLCRSVD